MLKRMLKRNKRQNDRKFLGLYLRNYCYPILGDIIVRSSLLRRGYGVVSILASELYRKTRPLPLIGGDYRGGSNYIKLFFQLVIIGFFFFSLSGCTREKSFTSVEDLEKYIKGQDWPAVQTIVRNGVKVSVRYFPSEALLISNYKRYEELKKMLAQDTAKTQAIRDSLLRGAREKIAQTKIIYDNSIYFSMTIGYEDPKRDIEYDKMKEGFSEYSAWMQKLVFSMKEYIYLDSPSAGEVPLALYDMQRTFGITKDRTFLLVFPRKFNEQEIINNKDKSLKVCIKEFGLATGSLEFDFPLPIVGVKIVGLMW